jgi:hypothetical protein
VSLTYDHVLPDTPIDYFNFVLRTLYSTATILWRKGVVINEKENAQEEIISL